MILVDTGPVVAAAVTTEVDHHVCTELFGGLHLAKRRLMLPATVLSEVGHLLGRDLGTYAEARFIRSIAGGDFHLVNLEPEDVDRMAELVEQYEDSKMDTTDALVIACRASKHHRGRYPEPSSLLERSSASRRGADSPA